MGRRAGRGAALNAALAETLARVADLLTDAREPWWVIAGAAAALHGVAGPVRDVDVLLAEPDARRLADTLDLLPEAGEVDPRFRSALLLTWRGAPLPVEIMASFKLRTGDAWQPVAFATREPIRVGRATVFVPAREELRALLLAFDRPKDRARAALLA